MRLFLPIFFALFTFGLLASETNLSMPSTPKVDVLSKEERAWISENPSLFIASIANYSALAMNDEKGNARGFEPDLLALINQNLNINLKIKLYTGWESAYNAASKGEVDGIFSLTHTKARESIFNFSPVYHQDPTYLITKNDDHSVQSLVDLNGKTVVTENANIINEVIRKEAPKANIIHAPTINDILQTLYNGNADVAVLEAINKQHLDALGLKVAASAYTISGEYTIGTHKSKPLLGPIITKGIQSISKEQKQRLKNKWFDKQYGSSLFTTEELKYIQNTPVIKIGIEDWPPLISTKDGTSIEGIVGELLSRVIEISGLKIKLISGPWNELLRDFKNQKIDILPATYYTEERATYGLYSDSYSKINNLLYVTKDNNTIKSFEDLHYKTLAIQKGFGTIDAIRAKYPKIKIIETPSLEDAILKVSNKEVDALFEAQIVAQNYIQKLLINNLKPIYQNSIDAGSLHIFSRKDDVILQSIINKSLQSIPPQEKNNIIDKWLNQEIKKSVNIAFTKNREPYSMDKQLLKGIEYEIASKVLAKSNISINYEKFLSRSQMETALLDDAKLDMAVGVKQSNHTLFYSDPLVSFENIVITRKEDLFDLSTIQDLSSKKIIAFEGASNYLGKEYQKLFDTEQKPLNYAETSRQEEQVRALVTNEVNAIIMDKNIFLWYLKKHYKRSVQDYTFHALFPSPNIYKVAFKDKNLRDLFNKHLSELKSSGEYAEIFYNYLQTDIENKTKIGTLIASSVANAIFTEDTQKMNDIISVFSTLPYVQKIEVFNNENELLYTNTNTKFEQYMLLECVHAISHISHKVGYIKLYFDDVQLAHYLRDNSAIPPITYFSHLPYYADIQATYKRLSFFDKPLFTQKEEEFIKTHPVINFAGFHLKPLYIQNDNGTVGGIFVDYLHAIENQSGLHFNLFVVPNKIDLYNRLNDKSIDVIADTHNFISNVPSKLQSSTFVKYRFVIVTTDSGSLTNNLENIQGNVAIVSNSNGSSVLKTLYPHISLIETQTHKEALALVAQGKANYYLGNEAIVPYIITDFPNLKIVGITENSTPYYFVGQLDQPELISIINKSLEMLTYEQKEAINAKWVKYKIKTEMDYSTINKVVGISLCIIIFIVISNQRLKYLVRQKTLELEKMLTSFDKNVIAAKIDPQGHIIYASRALCKILEYSSEELVGQSTYILHNKTSKRIQKEFKHALETHAPWRGKLIVASKHGKPFWTKNKLFPEYDEKGNFLHFTLLSQDITAQKEVETLYKEIEDTQKEIIFKMGAIGEARSQETGAHVKRVAEYSRLFAMHYGLSSEEANIIKLASPMHDIGKVAIPDSILNKAGRLSDEEFNIIKTHAELGYEMLKNSRRTILKAAAIIAHEHHEKYDGTGYPRGLKGEEIHIYGRITAIADVFDALGHKRVYKDAWEDDKIFEFFRKERGHHFDPDLVDIFFEHLNQFMEIKNAYESKT